MEEDPMVSLRSVLGEPDRRRGRRLLEGRTPRLVVAVGVIAVGVVLGAGLGPTDHPGAGDPPAPPREHATVDSAASSTSASPSSATSTTEAVRLWPTTELTVDGRVVSNDEGRWEVGTEGDLVAVGDWDCDRLPTPAVLRPATGEVAVFDRWAGDAPEPARRVAMLAGATEVRPSHRCGEVVVRGPAGDEQAVDTTPGAS